MVCWMRVFVIANEMEQLLSCVRQKLDRLRGPAEPLAAKVFREPRPPTAEFLNGQDLQQT